MGKKNTTSDEEHHWCSTCAETLTTCIVLDESWLHCRKVRRTVSSGDWDGVWYWCILHLHWVQRRLWMLKLVGILWYRTSGWSFRQAFIYCCRLLHFIFSPFTLPSMHLYMVSRHFRFHISTCILVPFQTWRSLQQ